MNNVVNLYKGDCLTEHERIESGSADLILCDPPYGTMRGAQLDGWAAEARASQPLKQGGGLRGLS